MNFRNKEAFTLAEVLIVLGIIGVIAAMTIPTLIQNYQKNQTVTHLKATYTILYQALKSAEADYGDMSTWDFPTNDDNAQTVKFLHTYMLPYLKTINIDDTTSSFTLINGVKVNCHCWGPIHLFIYLQPNKKDISGKNHFMFYFYQNNPDIRGLVPYSAGYPLSVSREAIKTQHQYGCSKGTQKLFCAWLIMRDNWQISEDYPW